MGSQPREDRACYASKAQRSVLSALSQIQSIHRNFFLTGGTALAVFYLHHRSSEDIDLFSTGFRQLASIDPLLRGMFRDDLALTQATPEFRSYLIREVKVDFVFDPLSATETRPLVGLEAGGDILVDTLANISSNKLCAITSRFEPKDMIDFYFISETLWGEMIEAAFLNCYELAKKKEALLDDLATAAYQIEESLTRTLRAQTEQLPTMQKEMDWAAFENRIRFYIALLYRMQKW